MRSVLINVHGRVQGVFYRASTKDQAITQGVKGWVKNLPDGRVQIKAEGSTEAVGNLVEWCKKGPQFANVTDVLVEDVSKEGFDSFEIVR
ncbi:MAG: acylphosphatase [Cyclobacteriaceae bacterium]